METTYILSQICGLISLVIFCYSYFTKSKTSFLIYQSIGNFFYASSFIIVNAYVAGFVTIFSTVRTITFYFCQKYNYSHSILILFAFIIANTAIFVAFFNGTLDIIPFATSTMYIVIYYIKNLQLTRYLTLIPNALLLIYSTILMLYVNSILSIVEIIITIVAIIKFNRSNHSTPPPAPTASQPQQQQQNDQLN